MLIELWPIDRPKDYPQNPRKWSAHAVEKVAASIREYGWRQPVVVDTNEVIAIGHLRRAAGRLLELTEVPVHVARDLTPAQIRGLRLADNRTNQEASWDEEALARELQEIQDLDIDLSLTGFDPGETDKLLLLDDEERANAASCQRPRCRSWATSGCWGRTVSSAAMPRALKLSRACSAAANHA